MDERMEAITVIVHDTAFSQKLHADMIVSLDTQLQQLAEATARNTKSIQALIENAARLDENAARLDIKFERLAEIMTGLLQRHEERIASLERK